MNDTYRISVWDVDEGDGWLVRYRGLSKWDVRRKLRELYRGGWSQISVKVKAETHDRPGARWSRGFCASASAPKSVRRKWIA